MELLVAFATDNGKSLMSRHFGDAKFYDIYKISKTDTEFLEQIENTTEEEKQVYRYKRLTTFPETIFIIPTGDTKTVKKEMLV